MTRKQSKHRRKKGVRIIPKILSGIIVLAIAASAIWGSIALLSGTQKNVVNSMYPLKYEEYVKKAAKEYNLDEALIYGVIKTESNFNPEAESHVGAVGIMQIMPESFSWLQEIRGVPEKYDTDSLLDPEICIDYGCYLLKYFYDLYGTEQTAVAAYNAGFVVGDWLEDRRYSSDGVTLDYIPYPETEAYVEKVLSAKEKYNEHYFN